MKKIIKNHIFSFILGGLIFGSCGIAFASNFLARDVTYTPNDSSFNVNNVGSALDKLYEMDKISETIDNAECIHGSFVCGTDCTGSTGQLIENEFVPNLFIVYSKQVPGSHIYDSKVSSANFTLDSDRFEEIALSTYYEFKNGGWYVHGFGSHNNGTQWYYMACK